MTEVVFYHLKERPLEKVLPGLLERSLQRGWRVAVQTSSEERAEALDAHLWTYSDESFLPHGLAGGDLPAEQPIVLTSGAENPNRADVRFLVDRASVEEYDPYQRVVVIFDGNDPDSVADARLRWKEALANGHDATYWRQSETGRWEKVS